MTTISAKTILRSRNARCPEKVLSTLLLRYPRWIHAEFMTHRVFSRNAASSRAIPVEKLIKDVMDYPAIPIFWGKNQKGMQADDECKELVRLPDSTGLMPVSRELAWKRARNDAVHMALSFHEAGYHKQIINRLLEPFAHITVLVSATEWDNFLALRDHPAAEPHMQMLAREIGKCLQEGLIQKLLPGEWHLPFVRESDVEVACEAACGDQPVIESALRKLSTARCASTSYKTVDGHDMTFDRAIEIHDKLVGSNPIHASPAEHVAQVDDCLGKIGDSYVWMHQPQHGNFVGFQQYRKMLEARNALS